MSLKKKITVSLAALAVAATGGFVLAADGDDGQAGGAESGLANPASVFCEEQGGTIRMEEGTEGQYGICILPDGSEVDEWEYWRQHH